MTHPSSPAGRPRTVVAQQVPQTALAGFPAYRLDVRTVMHRAHLAGRGPWWFCNDGGGRFDLPAPGGTCYLATDPAVAVRERLGGVLGGAPFVPVSLLEDVVVSRLRVPESRRLANLRVARAADFGVTRELESMTPYAVPQAWACGLAGAGFEGVRYGPRFTPGAASSLALFDEAGERPWPVDPAPTAAVAVPGVPRPMPVPARDELTVVRPPRTRTVRHQAGGPRP